jgi:hypothetical protein
MNFQGKAEGIALLSREPNCHCPVVHRSNLRAIWAVTKSYSQEYGFAPFRASKQKAQRKNENDFEKGGGAEGEQGISEVYFFQYVHCL